MTTNCAAEGFEPAAQRARRLGPLGRRVQQIGLASAADPRRAVPGRTDGHGGLSFLDVSSLNLAAGSEGSAALFGQIA